MQNINLNKKSGTQLFWALAIVMWGIYITFL